MIKLLLVDDLAAVRSGLRMRLALEDDLIVVGEAEDGTLALEAARELHPDIVLMDAEMPRMDGIAATVALRTELPHTIVIILSLNDDAASRDRALAAGASAFVSKRTADTALIGAIRQVYYGQKTHQPPLAAQDRQPTPGLEAAERGRTPPPARRIQRPQS